jgi:hypothetical protein
MLPSEGNILDILYYVSRQPRSFLQGQCAAGAECRRGGVPQGRCAARGILYLRHKGEKSKEFYYVSRIPGSFLQDIRLRG